MQEPTFIGKVIGVIFWVALLCGMVACIYFCGMHKPGPYYYGHCDSCGRSWKVSSWQLPMRLDNGTTCPKCGRGHVSYAPIDSEEWKEEKEKYQDGMGHVYWVKDEDVPAFERKHTIILCIGIAIELVLLGVAVYFWGK
jgi:hypothetical protein